MPVKPPRASQTTARTLNARCSKPSPAASRSPRRAGHPYYPGTKPKASHGSRPSTQPRPGRVHRSDNLRVRKGSVASRLRSLRSPLRGLDPTSALPLSGICRSGGRLRV
jgi:hypothetical protein